METYDANSDREFVLMIQQANSVVDVNPAVDTPGLFAHGHARIKKRGRGRRRMTWNWDREFSIEIAPLGSDDTSGGDDPGLIWETTPPPTQELTPGRWSYSIDLRQGDHNETVAYKYTVRVGGVSVVDPVIIIDR